MTRPTFSRCTPGLGFVLGWGGRQPSRSSTFYTSSLLSSIIFIAVRKKINPLQQFLTVCPYLYNPSLPIPSNRTRPNTANASSAARQCRASSVSAPIVALADSFTHAEGSLVHPLGAGFLGPLAERGVGFRGPLGGRVEGVGV